MNTTTCGDSTHENDCLCDVEIKQISTIAPIDPERYWGMRFALNAEHNLDSQQNILKLFEALCTAKDRVTVKMAEPKKRRVDQLENFQRRDSKGRLLASKDLKNKLKQFVAEGRSMLDAPKEFNCTWSDCLGSLTQGAESEVWGWSQQFWAQLEAFMLGHDTWCGYRALMKQFNIGRGPATQLERLYRHANFTERARAHQCATALLIASPRAKSAWIIKKVGQQNLTITTEQVISLRARLTETGLIPKRGILMEEWRQQTQAEPVA